MEPESFNLFNGDFIRVEGVGIVVVFSIISPVKECFVKIEFTLDIIIGKSLDTYYFDMLPMAICGKICVATFT